ncbi:MAG TPA: glycosyltransferase family 9 protein [Micromonosporaceae bacterium]
MPERYRDILVVDLLGGLGDLILVLPAVHALARRNPGARLRVLTHQPGAALLTTDPTVTEVVTPDHDRPGAERDAVRRELARRPPDLAISTTRYDGIPAILDAGAGRAVTDLWRRPPADELVDRRYLRILRDEGLIEDADLAVPARVYPTPRELADADAALDALLPGDPRPPVVLVPGAGMAVKRWPVERWVGLAQGLTARGVEVLAVSGDGCEVPGARCLPPTTVRGLAAYFAVVARRGGVVVGGDTGPSRVAVAAGARAVGLFGPTLATRYGLDPRPAVNLQGLPGCPVRRPTAITEQRCWWHASCPLSPEGPACMAALSTTDVLDAVCAMLSG